MAKADRYIVALPLRCADCGRRWDDPVERWRVHFTADDPPVPATYCPGCAALESEPDDHAASTDLTHEALRLVRAAVAGVESSLTELERAIRTARKTSGLREIAAVAGMSHEKVRQICGASRSAR